MTTFKRTGRICCGGDTPCPPGGLTRRQWAAFLGFLAVVFSFTAWNENR